MRLICTSFYARLSIETRKTCIYQHAYACFTHILRVLANYPHFFLNLLILSDRHNHKFSKMIVLLAFKGYQMCIKHIYESTHMLCALTDVDWYAYNFLLCTHQLKRINPCTSIDEYYMRIDYHKFMHVLQALIAVRKLMHIMHAVNTSTGTYFMHIELCQVKWISWR